MLTKIFYEIDNFCKGFEENWEKNLIGEKSRSEMSLSEIMTITVYFHYSGCRTFKDYYKKYVKEVLKEEFPKLLSYNRFVELMETALIPLIYYLKVFRRGECTGISFIDSTKLVVSHNRRIHQHKTFKGMANRGKDSIGWFYGFKLHLVINEKGEIINFALTPGNVDDRNIKVFKDLVKDVIGKLFGDKGYISSKLEEELLSNNNIQLITKQKKNMKEKIIPIMDKILLRKRAVIESVNDELKNSCYIEHSRHRNPWNFLVNLFSGLIAYSFKPSKPSINFSQRDLDILSNLPALAF